MAKKAKSLHTKKGLELKIVNPNAAGIDIADTEMQVCVPSDRDGENNRRFGSFTRDLEEISGWLKACGVDTVAMEATGVYWIPLFFRLQEDGFDVILCNARDVKNISEKKTDEADAEWLMLLHSYGLLKPSFQPENEARQVRNLCRHRNALLRSAAREVQHMQKAMEQMNVKLTNVLSDIVGVSGKRIIGAILDDGERDPAALAEMADGRCKRSKEEIALSLEGTWDEDHLFVLRQSRDLYEFYQGMIAQCDAEIEALRGTDTMPTMLPGSSFFLGLPYGRARDYVKAGLGVALASDYNPGSSPSGDMRFVMALGCIRMRLTPVEAFNAVTLNSAYAMGVSDRAGSVTVGKLARLILTEPGWDLTKIAYQYQTPFIRQIF